MECVVPDSGNSNQVVAHLDALTERSLVALGVTFAVTALAITGRLDGSATERIITGILSFAGGVALGATIKKPGTD